LENQARPAGIAGKIREEGLHRMLHFIQNFKRNDSGATAIEYGLIAALVAVALIGALTTLGTDLSGIFGDVSTELTDGT
jgi:pilus assembly protein Flp/PilA